LFVTELDGHCRFGHRTAYEFLLASAIAPRLRDNQGEGRDSLSGAAITEPMRLFLVARTGRMPTRWLEDDRVEIPAGNFISGGECSPDERPLQIRHLTRPFRIARAPVTNREWGDFLAADPDSREDAHYLRHWGLSRSVPPGQEDAPVHHLWPEDADRYAQFRGARLPTADEGEKAVRGIDGRRWPWGDLWRPGAGATAELGLNRPLPVRALGAQGDAGLFSAAGGVFEYTASGWRGRTDRGRVVMGGCYTHPAAVSRAGLRLSHKISGHLKAGLRLAWDVGR
jgi:formylglycine-generating enzyme required for sulfatase activity